MQATDMLSAHNGSAVYVPSGKAPAAGIIYALLAALTAAVVGGIVYAAALHFIPLVYLDIFLCAGLALAIGAAVGAGGKAGHLRNVGIAMLLGLAAGAVAEYVQWCMYATLLSSAKTATLPYVFLNYLTGPDELWDNMMRWSRRGLWSIGKSSRQMVKGEPLLAVWAIEAGILILGSALTARAGASKPYSEVCGAWMTAEKLAPGLAPLEDPKAQAAMLKNGDLSPLFQAGLPQDENHTLLTAFTCPGDPNAYLNITAVRVKKKNKKGTKVETTNVELAKYVALPVRRLEELRAYLKKLTEAPAESLERTDDEAAADTYAENPQTPEA